MEYIVADFTIVCEPSLLQTARDLIADACGEAGFESFEDTESGLKAYVQDTLLDRSLLQEGIDTLPLNQVEVTYTLAKVENKDWNEAWEEQGFEPITIDNRIIIYDARQGVKATPEGITPIYIRARQAFGTGTHQTTRMVIASLLQAEVAGKRVLDCGCGTGILGIAASKLGAEEVVSYDIDEWSVENTRYNAEQNDVNNLSVLQGDASVLSHVSGVFDIVMANINRNILLADMHAFKEVLASGGMIVLSGFYESDADMIKARAAEFDLHEVHRETEDDWCCLVLKEQ